MRRQFLLFLIAITASLTCCWAQDNSTIQNTVELSSSTWNVANVNGSINLEAGSLPVYVLEALVAQGILTDGDPINGYNSQKYRWVASETWSMYAEFNLEADLLDETNLDLVLEGVDTVAEVYINNELAGTCDNAHRQFRFDVKGLLTVGTNLIEILLSPAPEYAAARSADYPITVPAQPYSRGYPFFNFIRKPHSDFGWDWGPAFAPSGVYGSVRLEGYSSAFLTGKPLLKANGITQKHDQDGTVNVNFTASLQAPVDGDTGTLTVESDDMKWMGSEEVGVSNAGEAFVSVQIKIEDDYELWWPVGFGPQNLYNFTVTYTPDESNSTSGSPESSLTRRLGVRNIELVQEPIRDPTGLTFYFRVNGIPLFARGANMIPLQIFHSQNSEQNYRDLLEDAVDANMNMIRVWGGGLYQQDSFYDLCDEMGLLVWQEAMFACAQYPIDSDFLSSVRDEISYQAHRIGHHASLAIWGGNNEVETSFTWFPESSSNPSLFVSNYMKLFVDTIREELLKVDPNINFLDSSPMKGVYSLDPYTKRWGNPSAVNSGDVHFYDYSSNCLSLDAYPRAKFVSEYGFMSFPSFSVYEKYTTEPDWSILSNMSDFRQNHPNGNTELMQQMKFHFQQTAYNATNPAIQKRLFQQWIYLTQFQQAMCYEAGITNWRRLKSAQDAQTMGVLYWQLNDIWSGPSWSGRDFGGHWKLLMYGVKKFFSPVLISGTYNETQADALSVYITNDQPYKVTGTAKVEIILFSAHGYDQPLDTIETKYEVDALHSKVVNTTAIKRKLVAKGHNLQQAIVRLSTKAQGDQNELKPQTCLPGEDNPFASVCTPAKGFTPSEGQSLVEYESSQVVWLTEPKEAALPTNPRVRLSNFRQINDTLATFQISSRNVAVGVQLDTDSVEGRLSGNNLLVLPWEPQSLNFTSKAKFTISDLQSSLYIISLADTLSSGTPVGPYGLTLA